MENKRTRAPTHDELYMLSFLQDEETRKRELYKDIPDTNEPMVYTKKVAGQQKYRWIRELSMSRDNPPRLPCRPWYDNGSTEMWLNTGEVVKEYHKKRVEYYEIDFPISYLEDCLTCMDHRKCDDHLCMARRVSCYFYESEEGPPRVRAKKLAKRIAERPNKFN